MNPLNKNMHDWYFLRDGFDSLRLDPERHSAFLFGKLDRNRRNALVNGVEEACYGMRGYKAVMYGDYGRGKTHQCNNIIYEIHRRELPVHPVYVKCIEYGSKEAFASLFSQMVLGLGVANVRRVAQEYEHRVANGGTDTPLPIDDVIGKGDVAHVFKSLSLQNELMVMLALKWLGGEKLDKANIEKLGAALTPQLTVSRDFAAVMKGLAHMFREVDRRVILFFVDEAELLKGVTNPEANQKWTSSLRALTEITPVGYIFFVGANNEDDIPQVLVWDEVRTRIGAANYRDLPNPGDAAMRQWILEFLQTFVAKGPVPEPQLNALPADAQSTGIAPELSSIVGNDDEALRAFPFTPDALNEFVNHSVTDLFGNKPREILDRIDRAAARAMRFGRHRIEVSDVMSVRGETTDEEDE